MADNTNPASANEYIEQQLHGLLSAIEKRFDADAICFVGPLIPGVDDIIRVAIENKQEESPKEKLVVIVTTNGGLLEVVQRIVETLRNFYDTVDFVVPNYAYSAGTVFVMSGDAIYMDYYSRLGPTDPQIENKEGRLIPALGYVKRFEKLVQEARAGGISQAEIQLLISGFDQAVLYQFEQAQQLSITLLKEWLPKYKFKNWKITETSKKPVTDEMRAKRAEEIAAQLCDSDRWHTHGRGISKDVLDNDLGLKIKDFGKDVELSTEIRDYQNLISDYMGKMGNRCVLHTVGAYRVLG